MENEPSDETIGYTFQWKIEHKSQCWLKQGEEIRSPTFIADALERTKWFLSLYPMGCTDENYIGFYLHREVDCHGPAEIKVNFQLATLDENCSFLKEANASNLVFQKPKRWGCNQFVAKAKIFASESKAFFLKDTLTVQCTIWSKEIKPAKPKYLYARSLFQVIRRSSMWSIDKFSTLNSSMNRKFRDNLIDFDVVLRERLDFDKIFVININVFDERIKYFSFRISIIDSEGKKENYGALEYSAGDLKRGVLSSTQPLIIKLTNKIQYFPNDVLSLYCEYFISTQTNLNEFFEPGITSPGSENEVVESINEHCVKKGKFIETSVLVKDLNFMYYDAIFADTELRTSTRTFPAHKAILSARSPVFRRMFSHDMKERNTAEVNINDLDNETVHRMLFFMYTEFVENLQIESALKLYAAANKYEILSLKNKCYFFLKKNLCPTKACEVLLLADQHQDIDLKSYVQDYILKHDKEVFGCKEWKDFMSTNLKLAADIMYRKVYPPTV